MGEFSQKIALVRAEDDEGLEDEYAVSNGWSLMVYICGMGYVVSLLRELMGYVKGNKEASLNFDIGER